MKLYNYFRSSASYRVRIALNIKGLSYEYVSVHLVRNGGEQLTPAYRAVNPDALVPVLVDGNDAIPQSLAIIEYLDESSPGAAAVATRSVRTGIRAFICAASGVRNSSAE
jgi:maleylpyruvate isomerase